ncbi:hypothetical protein NLX86_16525 [Streptomyces sp. A3M-1-3]|uniref:hypothetical protein n=1 Tax=Streptomyces sp. A3M-1-3 TaxID=2962044 RepID=UPI0020B8E217|nr:hypothetical protein [Streptomyces sp. A3M-1-3]MCP3819648.1 hypothetical protein [Streptomyces sp. A3M-1-3]
MTTHEQVLAVCKSNWEYRGIDDASVREMLDELAAHLEDAASDGRGAEAVVGDDLKAFAAAWARAHTPLRARLPRIAAMVTFIIGGMLLFGHLFDRTAELPVSASRIAFFTVLAMVTVTWDMRRGSSAVGRGWLISNVAATAAAVLIVWLTGDETVFRMPLWSSLLLLVPGLPYAVADARAKRKHGKAPDATGPGVR